MSYLSVLRESLNAHLKELENELNAISFDGEVHLLDARPYSPLDDSENPPSKSTFDLIEKVHVDLKAVESIITPSQFKLVQLANSQYTSAALGAAVNLDIAGAIESLGGNANVKDLAKKVDTNEHKLGTQLQFIGHVSCGH